MVGVHFGGCQLIPRKLIPWSTQHSYHYQYVSSQWSTEALASASVLAEDRPSDSAKMPKVTEELAEDLKFKFLLIVIVII